MKPTLSVVIPVYKVEDYLERCVMSVLKQDYRDLEVILVDDGSPDRCPQICDNLATVDERVRVIHKPNGGLSSARNKGIEVASGEFLAFLDSDDQWAEGALNLVMDNLYKYDVDMLMFRSKSLYPDGTYMERNDGAVFKDNIRVYNRVDLYRSLIESGNLHEQAGTHVVKTSFIKDNDLYFKEGILGEDTEWMFRVMRFIRDIAVSNVVLQVYTERRQGSITNTNSAKSLNDLIFVIQESIAYYKNNQYIDVQKFELAQCAYLWSIALGYYSLLPPKVAKPFKDSLKSICKDLDLMQHPKSKMVAKVYSFMGFDLTSKILCLYMKLHSKNLVNAKTKVNG